VFVTRKCTNLLPARPSTATMMSSAMHEAGTKGTCTRSSDPRMTSIPLTLGAATTTATVDSMSEKPCRLLDHVESPYTVDEVKENGDVRFWLPLAQDSHGGTKKVAFATAVSRSMLILLCPWKLTSDVIPRSLQTRTVWPSTICVSASGFEAFPH
jgi:hypothetical protein